jgi:hypothetical protein
MTLLAPAYSTTLPALACAPPPVPSKSNWSKSFVHDPAMTSTNPTALAEREMIIESSR